MARLKLGWMFDLLTGTGGEPDLIIHPVTESQPPFDLSPFKVKRVELSPSGEAPAWHEVLSETLGDDEWMRALVYPVVAPERPKALTFEVRGPNGEALVLEGEAAFVAAALSSAAWYRSLKFLVSMPLLTQASTSGFREWLARMHRPEWIVYLGPAAARLMGADGLPMAFLSVQTGEHTGKGQPMVRFVDLRDKDNVSCLPQLREVAALGGGENAAGLTLGTTVLQSEPWIYERYTKSFREQRKDTGELGEIRTLGELASIWVGLKLKRLTEIRVAADGAAEAPAGTLRCYRARPLSDRRPLERPYFVQADKVDAGDVLEAGDVLVHLVANPKKSDRPLVVVTLTEDDVPAICERPIFVVRFNPDVAAQARELLAGFLASGRMRGQLISKGVTGSLSASTLGSVEVPSPREDVMTAIATLGELEARYLEWAHSVRDARQELFDASSYAETIPRLLEREREERERVLAAEASQHLEYKVRNYFPRPIAVRWERLAQLPPGEERIRRSLECAEHLITFVGLLSMVQVVDGHDVCWCPSSKVRSFKGGGGLYFDWGMMQALVLEGANRAASAADPLLLPFPELERLTRSADGVLSWTEAEVHLHQVRNDLSHLQRPTAAQINEFSQAVDSSLEALFRAAAFIGNYPLVHVADYSMDAVTGERELRLAFHQGVGTATREEVRSTENEVGRGAVGVPDHRGMFRCLSPWIIYERNPETLMEDLFVFNRAREDEVTYISMASGAPLAKHELARRWKRLLDDSEALKEGS